MNQLRLLVLFPLLLAGCQTLGGWADDLGRHMPVIGERCDHWQCVTESGQESSRLNQRMRMRRDEMGQERQAPPQTPPESPQPLSAYEQYQLYEQQQQQQPASQQDEPPLSPAADSYYHYQY